MPTGSATQSAYWLVECNECLVSPLHLVQEAGILVPLPHDRQVGRVLVPTEAAGPAVPNRIVGDPRNCPDLTDEMLTDGPGAILMIADPVAIPMIAPHGVILMIADPVAILMIAPHGVIPMIADPVVTPMIVERARREHVKEIAVVPDPNRALKPNVVAPRFAPGVAGALASKTDGSSIRYRLNAAQKLGSMKVQ